MTAADITLAISKWSDIRSNSASLLTLFAQGNYFAYTFPDNAATSESIHAYPGIYQGKLYFFLVPAKYDTDKYLKTIDKYTIPCLVVSGVGSGEDRITSAEAKLRMKNWNDFYPTWVPNQVQSTYGIYQAFKIKTVDFEERTLPVSIYFALKGTPAAQVNFEADLIVANTMPQQQALVYDDYVQPVPPFSASATSDSFALLP